MVVYSWNIFVFSANLIIFCPKWKKLFFSIAQSLAFSIESILFSLLTKRRASVLILSHSIALDI
ncbi:hypothetical protein GLOIN_2v1711900 [Rhizophagus irregularis DAOM 181602=DAOM 197198]|uniref:Uncharacterized protein n=1 Tax=Rhizophagus irregularis (strain DAOM 181602 / DAOM 197198 / MUCL 43194) TaxID=747089 RepID=A0A2P4P5B2_RHIID|nr:hypothetical protein GLOIN_2v1711900 [Rhizophagus irregularis DAOM 181602=DAOM 197198]POG60575.1 hypothetical protein GLOIN_2v1711900 [Rhizophagus irregularis DAOM 181602=DAOM 197198]|eukprot:XP_025167441.1 hypothetical protein GLOIN_2v1711900 [Rhizophagus irregularis DAOM 181602=DAOM 197198]